MLSTVFWLLLAAIGAAGQSPGIARWSDFGHTSFWLAAIETPREKLVWVYAKLHGNHDALLNVQDNVLIWLVSLLYHGPSDVRSSWDIHEHEIILP